jgi:hypothetical protein
MGEWRYSFTTYTPVPIGEEAGWAPAPFWMLWRRQDLTSTGNRTLAVRLIFLIGIVGGGLQLGPFGTAATNRPIVPASGDYDDGEIGGIIGRGNRSTRIKLAPVPLCPPQTPHAARTRTRAAAVGSQRLTAWATARPPSTSQSIAISTEQSRLPLALVSLNKTNWDFLFNNILRAYRAYKLICIYIYIYIYIRIY